ncbi:MAG: flavodoxin family protein [Syntrophales bacterium]|nr:flavodoxin family protein [Syntrophales bacterium]MCK9391494.1 flavodoxin family protein [Syntrophales bacterium]
MSETDCSILGIHSSPFKNGNTAYLLQHSLEEATKMKGVSAESVAIAGLSIADCRHCNWCMRGQTSDTLCSIEDDASPILKKIRDCDLLVLASPVYFSRLSGTMACLIDRTRCFTFGKEGHLALKDKVGIALAVGWCRNTGMETTLASLYGAFLVHEMWTLSCHPAGALYGVGAVAGQRNEDLSYKENKLGVKEDREALRNARLLIRKAVQTARVIKSSSAPLP